MDHSRVVVGSMQGWVQICICIGIQKFCVFELKITKGHVFDIWSVYENYLQIQSNTYKITNKS